MATVRAVLEKLRIKPGLRGSSERVEGPWRIGFFYDRDTKQFAIDLFYNEHSKRVGLVKDDVETRGRSTWMADNTWRLTQAAVDRLTPSIEGVIERTQRQKR